MNRQHPTVVSTLEWLCRIPSPIGEERALCDALVERLGATPLPGPIRRYGDSIVVPVGRAAGRPRIALAGHLDTVRTSHDGPVRIEGDKLYGAGAADMKSGLALMLDLLEHEADLCKRTNLTFVFYAKEEGPFADNELGPVLEQDAEVRAVDLAVCLEPSDNKLSLGASGSIHATLTFEGTTAHSARPWQGRNAIHAAGPLLTKLSELAPKDVIVDGLTYRTVTSITMAEGGRGRNIVPDAFELNLNHRFAPGVSIEQAQRDIEHLVDGAARITWRDLSPSALPHASHPGVKAFKNAGAKGVEPKQAWTDVARFSALGIAAINFGPGENAQAHQRNEWTTISALIEGREIVRRWLSEMNS